MFKSLNALKKPSQTLNSMSEPRAGWGQGGWNDRRVVWLFANTNRDQSPAHGWYAIFEWWDRGYTLNRNIRFKGEGNPVHKNVFIAKVAYQGKDKLMLIFQRSLLSKMSSTRLRELTRQQGACCRCLEWTSIRSNLRRRLCGKLWISKMIVRANSSIALLSLAFF